MQQARSSEQKVADKKKVMKSAADSATFDPKSLLAWVAVVQHLQTEETDQIPPAQIWPLPADTASAAAQRTKRDMAPKLSLYTDLIHQYWSWGAWVRSYTTKTHQIIGTSVSAAHMHIRELVITTASSASIYTTNPHTLSSPVYQQSSIRSRIFKT